MLPQRLLQRFYLNTADNSSRKFYLNNNNTVLNVKYNWVNKLLIFFSLSVDILHDLYQCAQIKFFPKYIYLLLFHPISESESVSGYLHLPS